MNVEMYVRLFVPLTMLFYCANGKAALNSGGYGYLFSNQSSPFDCVKPSQSKLCSLDYNIFQFTGPSGAAVTKAMYTSVALTLATLTDFGLHYRPECLESLRHYACNNTFAQCTNDGTIKVTYNFKETEKACQNVLSRCPKEALEYLVYNCTNINRNPMKWVTCVNLPVPKSPICRKNEKNNYKYAKGSADMYQEYIKLFAQGFALLKPHLTKECQVKFVDTVCQLQPGAICSNDQSLRMFAISRQDCLPVMKTCLAKLPPNIQHIYEMMCEFLPDANKAPKVPLPSLNFSPNDLNNLKKLI